MNSGHYATETPTSSAQSKLTVTIFESFQSMAAIRDEWDAFVEASGSDIYFTIDWLQIWWKYYGHNRTLRCFLFRNHAKVVATLPFFLQTITFGPFAIRLARFVGADFTISVFYPPIETHLVREILNRDVSALDD